MRTKVRSTSETWYLEAETNAPVLSDPKRRNVYDLLGKEGLKSDWEVGQRLKTNEEVRTLLYVSPRLAKLNAIC